MQKRPNLRRLQAEATKAALFSTAISLFNEKGYHAVTVDEITRRAGTAKGNFYRYFAKKSDVLVEEFRTIDDYYRRVSKTLSKYPDAVQKLLAFTKAQCKYVRDVVGLDLMKILITVNVAEPAAEKSLIDTSRFLHGLVKGIVDDGQKAGQVRTDIPSDRLAAFYNRAQRSVFLDWAISDGAFDLVKAGAEFFDAVFAPALASTLAPSLAPRGGSPATAGGLSATAGEQGGSGGGEDGAGGVAADVADEAAAAGPTDEQGGR